MKTIYITLLLTIVLSATSCSDTSKKQTVAAENPIAVTVSSTTLENETPFLTASGKIEAVNSANLSTRMMGFVNKIHVNVGDNVQEGQLLVSINNAELSAKNAQVNAGVTEANAAFKNSEKDYIRFKNLFAESSASQKELDDITARYEMAKARLEAAKQMKNEVASQFSYVNIRAPFNGVVTNKFIDEGAMASPGIPLIALEAPSNFEVTAMVPESEISQIKPDTEVVVIVKSINESIKGKITEVSTSAKNTGGQYLVKIALDKTNAAILSGMYTTVQFPVEKKSIINNQILIPVEVLVTNGQLSGVYTVSESNTAMLRWLRLGRTFGNTVEVLSGLNANEPYIISAESKLYNGAPITIKQ
jgi:RND family efflux transporter MFP subunit